MHHLAVVLAAAVATLLPTAANAADLTREEPPLPDPMVCPIDAPVRVASADTLKRFSALAGCTDDAIIVSPATHLPRPRGAVSIGEAGTDPEALESALFFADDDTTKTKGLRRGKGKRAKQPEPPAATVETGTIGRSGTTVVRIAPAVQFPELEFAAVVEPASPVVATGAPAAMPAATGPLTEAAILALRPASYTSPHDDLISAAANKYGVDPLMLHAVITQESRYKSSAVSHAGARGLMQVMPGTGAMMGVSNAQALFDPATNVNAGARLLKHLWRRFSGRFDLVLAAYNAGEGAVTKYGYRVPPYRETQNYVVLVQGIYRKLVAERGLSFGGR